MHVSITCWRIRWFYNVPQVIMMTLNMDLTFRERHQYNFSKRSLTCVQVRVPQETELIDRHAYIHYEQMAHGIMEAEKSHLLLSGSWRPRKANSVILVQRPENQRIS